jgi:Family of unknown function (DUF6074)
MINRQAPPTCTVIVMRTIYRVRQGGDSATDSAAAVLPFPPCRRPAKVADVALKLARCRTRRHRGYYLEQTRETVIGVLVRRGVAAKLAAMEADRFIQAVLCETARIQRAGEIA